MARLAQIANTVSRERKYLEAGDRLAGNWGSDSKSREIMKTWLDSRDDILGVYNFLVLFELVGLDGNGGIYYRYVPSKMFRDKRE